MDLVTNFLMFTSTAIMALFLVAFGYLGYLWLRCQYLRIKLSYLESRLPSETQVEIERGGFKKAS